MRAEFTVNPAEEGRRLDAFLAKRIAGLSRTRAQKLIEEGAVRVFDTRGAAKNYRVRPGDVIAVEIPAPAPTPVLQPEPIPLDILYEDGDLLVVNKPRGLVVHPAPGHSSGTLVNALLHYCRDLSGIGGVLRPGIVHRLDKDTTGLLLAAKNDYAHRSLATQLKARRMRREYLALVRGRVSPPAGRIDAPVGRHPRQRKKMAVVPGGREAVTRYRVLAYLGDYTLLRLYLETGRTHQVRVHMSFLGHPVAGDPVYGKPRAAPPETLLHGQALHARRISFTHPRTGRLMQFTAPLPEDFRRALHHLRHP